MLLEVILKKDAPVLDILCRSGELEPLAPIPMNNWGFLEHMHQVRHESTAIGEHTTRKKVVGKSHSGPFFFLFLNCSGALRNKSVYWSYSGTSLGRVYLTKKYTPVKVVMIRAKSKRKLWRGVMFKRRSLFESLLCVEVVALLLLPATLPSKGVLSSAMRCWLCVD